MNDPWVWRCTRCERLLHRSDLVPRYQQYWHWDPVLSDWCGPVGQAVLR